MIDTVVKIIQGTLKDAGYPMPLPVLSKAVQRGIPDTSWPLRWFGSPTLKQFIQRHLPEVRVTESGSAVIAPTATPEP